VGQGAAGGGKLIGVLNWVATGAGVTGAQWDDGERSVVAPEIRAVLAPQAELLFGVGPALILVPEPRALGGCYRAGYAVSEGMARQACWRRLHSWSCQHLQLLLALGGRGLT
jgi:hypothetical protein